MFGKKENKDVDSKKINDILGLSKNILKVVYVLVIILAIYIFTILTKELKIFSILLKLLKVVSPLFIGIVIAWLFDPFVSFLQKKGIKRGLGAGITYVIIIGILTIIFSSLIPVLSDQLNDFVKIIPNIIEQLKTWIEGILNRFQNINGLNIDNLKLEMFNHIGNIGTSMTKEMPTMFLNFTKAFFSGLGTLIVGLVIGFYLLISFDNANETIITLFPKKLQSDLKDLIYEANTSLRKFVNGAIIDAGLIFIVTSACFLAIGLRAPLLFALFCALTNFIPYAGPYIGGIPAVIVGFSQSPTIGILILVSIVVIQFLEGNFLQALIMSKTTSLHPVTIMLGLLVFGYFWGIIGMFISTPIISVVKTVLLYLDKKYGILSFE